MKGHTLTTRFSRPVGALLLLGALSAIGAAPTLFAQAAAQSAIGATPRISLTAGRSTVLNVDFDVTRIAVTNPAIADAVVVAPREILLDGKASGTISLIIWGDGRRVQYDVAVDAAVTPLLSL